MNTPICEQLSERMPAVASGEAPWSAVEMEHVESCAACRDEWALVQATAQLGLGLDAPADPGALAEKVLAQVRVAEQAEVVRRRVLRRWQVGFAATAAVLVAVFFWMPGRFRPAADGSPTAAPIATEGGLRIPLAELDHADSTELTAALRMLGKPLDDESTLEPFSSGELEDDDFARALRAMEG